MLHKAELSAGFRMVSKVQMNGLMKYFSIDSSSEKKNMKKSEIGQI